MADIQRWYRQESEAEAVRLLKIAADDAIKRQAPRRGLARMFASAHEGIGLTSFGSQGYRFDQRDVYPDWDQPQIQNICRAINLTVVAKLSAADSPLPQFMADGGDWQERTKTVRCDRLVMAEYAQPQGRYADLHEVHRHGVTLAVSCTGTYFVFFFAGDKQIRAELDDTLTLGIETSGRFGRLASLVRTVWYDADELAADYPDQATEIYAAETEWDTGPTGFRDTEIDAELRPRRGVKVIQGWFCAYRDVVGWELFCLEDGTVLCSDREYDRAQPPCVRWDFERSLFGEWGVPLTMTTYEQVSRLNRSLSRVDNAEEQTPQGLVLLPTGIEGGDQLRTTVKGWLVAEVSNPGAVVIKESPKFSSQSMDLIAFYRQGAQDISGVSDQHMAARKASGTTSGKHEHLVAALFTERFADQERRLIQCRAVDTARQIVYVLQSIADEDPEYFRVWRKGEHTEKIKLSDLDLDLSKYTIKIAPVSEEKDTPATRLDRAYESLQRGELSGTDYVALEQHYDLRSKTSLAIAQDSWIEQQIDHWLNADDDQREDPDFYQSPTKWIDLDAALRQVSQAHMQSRSQGAPSKTLEYFERFMAECSAYKDQQTAAAKTSISAKPNEIGGILPGAAGAQSPQLGGPTNGG